MKISIMGDSISTFEGSNPQGYRVFYEGYKARINEMDAVTKTWWYQVIDSLNGELCVNNSYSGSRVSGLQFPASYSERRICELRDITTPDHILAYIGFNDFGYHVPIGRLKCFEWA